MTITFQRATRSRVRLKILLTGPSGSGKTLGALHLARGLAPNGKIALIDSEHDRSGYYADRIEFDSCSLDDHKPSSYVAALDLAVAAGYEVAIIDSASHAWENVLDRKEKYDRANPKSNSFTNWKTFSREWDDFTRQVLESPIHVIVTARAKMAHEQQVGADGKKSVVKLGLAPILRDGTEYDYALSFSLEASHAAFASKDNTGLFTGDGIYWDLTDGRVPQLLQEWLSSAKEIERPTSATSQALDDAILDLPEAKQSATRSRLQAMRQKGLSEQKAQEVLVQLRAMAAAATAAQPQRPESLASAHATEPTPAPAVESAAAATPAATPPVSRAPMPLSDAASYTVTISGGVKPLGDISTKALEKLLPLARERRNAVLVEAIGVVLADRQQVASDTQASAPPVEVPAMLGAPDLEVARRMKLRYRNGEYQVQMLPSRTLKASLTRHDLAPEVRAGIAVVLRWREANPLHPDVQQVEAYTRPDEVDATDERLMGSTFGT